MSHCTIRTRHIYLGKDENSGIKHAVVNSVQFQQMTIFSTLEEITKATTKITTTETTTTETTITEETTEDEETPEEVIEDTNKIKIHLNFPIRTQTQEDASHATKQDIQQEHAPRGRGRQESLPLMTVMMTNTMLATL